MRILVLSLFLLLNACAGHPLSASKVKGPAPTSLSHDQLREWEANPGAPIGVTLDLRSIAFSADGKTSYIGGNFSGTAGLASIAILKSIDQGRSWNLLSPALLGHSIDQIQTLGTREVLAFAVLEKEGSLFEETLLSVDEGETWQAKSWDRDENVRHVLQDQLGCCSETLSFAHFENAREGTIILQGNDKRARLQTADGGQTFSIVPTKIFLPLPKPEYLFKVSPESVGPRGIEIWKTDSSGKARSLYSRVPVAWVFDPQTLEFKVQEKQPADSH